MEGGNTEGSEGREWTVTGSGYTDCEVLARQNGGVRYVSSA